MQDWSVSGHDGGSVKFTHLMQCLHPFGGKAVAGERNGMNKQVARYDDFLFGKVDDGVPGSVAAPQMHHLYLSVSKIDNNLVRKGERGRLVHQCLGLSLCLL